MGKIPSEYICVLEMQLVLLLSFESLFFKHPSCTLQSIIVVLLSAMQTTSIMWQRRLGHALLPVPHHLQYTVTAAMLTNMLKGFGVSSAGLHRCYAGMIRNVALS